MENEEMKKCQYCAELIKAEALKCRYCGSNQSVKPSKPGVQNTSMYWQRVNEGKRIAGVCTGLARQFESPILILPLRIFFLLTTFLWLFGFLLYVVLWILMPPPTDLPGQGTGSTVTPPPPPPPAPPAPPANGETPPAVQQNEARAAGNSIPTLLMIAIGFVVVFVFLSFGILLFFSPFHSLMGGMEMFFLPLVIVKVLLTRVLLAGVIIFLGYHMIRYFTRPGNVFHTVA